MFVLMNAYCKITKSDMRKITTLATTQLFRSHCKMKLVGYGAGEAQVGARVRRSNTRYDRWLCVKAASVTQDVSQSSH